MFGHVRSGERCADQLSLKNGRKEDVGYNHYCLKPAIGKEGPYLSS